MGQLTFEEIVCVLEIIRKLFTKLFLIPHSDLFMLFHLNVRVLGIYSAKICEYEAINYHVFSFWTLGA